jgi:hypothetical protein
MLVHPSTASSKQERHLTMRYHAARSLAKNQILMNLRKKKEKELRKKSNAEYKSCNQW